MCVDVCVRVRVVSCLLAPHHAVEPTAIPANPTTHLLSQRPSLTRLYSVEPLLRMNLPSTRTTTHSLFVWSSHSRHGPLVTRTILVAAV
jgi:hypothetical protein